MTTTPAERQAASRAKKKTEGFVRTTLRLDPKSIARLRRLAKQDKTTQAKVIQVALLLAELRVAELREAKSPKPQEQTKRPVVIITNAAVEPTRAPLTPSQPAADTNPLPPPEAAPTAPQQADEADDIIRRAASSMER